MRIPSQAIAIAILLGLAGLAWLYLAGSARVTDETGEVVTAAIVNGAGETRLWDLPFGNFYAIPDREGVIEVRCRDGSRAQAGYVTGSLHTSVTVTSARPCTLREDR